MCPAGGYGAVVLASGGVDSAVCMALARRSGEPVLAVGIDYGQRNRIELEYLAKLAARLRCEVLIIRLDMSPWVYGGLVGNGPLAPSERATNYVPARNLLFLAIGASVAEAHGAKRLYLGAGASDAHHPDCTPTFLRAFGVSLACGLHAPPALRTPLIGLTKAQVILAAIEFGVPLELTWSCHLGGPEPCGICTPCHLRRDTFADLGRPDPALCAA